MLSSWISASIGGVMIGIASALLMLMHGRVAGISGITGSLLQRSAADRGWRLAFIGGLLASGVVASMVAPQAIGHSVRVLPLVIVAGLFVGYGTRLGSGCTSGHGVCGLSRLSTRSLVAVVTFMMTGAMTAIIVRAVS